MRWCELSVSIGFANNRAHGINHFHSTGNLVSVWSSMGDTTTKSATIQTDPLSPAKNSPPSKMYEMLIFATTRSPANAEGPRDALCRWKSYIMLHKWSRHCACRILQRMKDIQGHSKSLAFVPLDKAFYAKSRRQITGSDLHGKDAVHQTCCYVATKGSIY